MPRKAASSHEDKVRARAHELWERSGRPEGHHLAHWHQAEAEVKGGRPSRAPKSAGAKPKAAAKPKTAPKPKAAAAGATKRATAAAPKPAKPTAKPKSAAAPKRGRATG